MAEQHFSTTLEDKTNFETVETVFKRNQQWGCNGTVDIASSKAFSNAMAALQKELQNQRKSTEDLQMQLKLLINEKQNQQQIQKSSQQQILKQFTYEIDSLKQQNQSLQSQLEESDNEKIKLQSDVEFQKQFQKQMKEGQEEDIKKIQREKTNLQKEKQRVEEKYNELKYKCQLQEEKIKHLEEIRYQKESDYQLLVEKFKQQEQQNQLEIQRYQTNIKEQQQKYEQINQELTFMRNSMSEKLIGYQDNIITGQRIQQIKDKQVNELDKNKEMIQLRSRIEKLQQQVQKKQSDIKKKKNDKSGQQNIFPEDEQLHNLISFQNDQDVFHTDKKNSQFAEYLNKNSIFEYIDKKQQKDNKESEMDDIFLKKSLSIFGTPN